MRKAPGNAPDADRKHGFPYSVVVEPGHGSAGIQTAEQRPIVMNNGLELILKQVLAMYPELGDYAISVRYVPLPNAYAQYDADTSTKKALIEIDASLKRRSKSIKRAAIVSELSHIVKEKKIGKIGKWLVSIEQWLYYHFGPYRHMDERHTDMDAISRGFGRDLLILLEHADQKGNESEGITLDELTKILEEHKC